MNHVGSSNLVATADQNYIEVMGPSLPAHQL